MGKIFFTSFLAVAAALLLFLTSGSLKKGDACDRPYATFTFDDGYDDHYKVALPIFKKYGAVATDYVVTGLVGGYFENQKLMDWRQILELQKSGWEIGSHTVNHANLTAIDYDTADKEMRLSKQGLLEKGLAANTVAIPYGRYNGKIKTIAEKYYSAARASNWGLNSFVTLDRHDLKSFWVTNSTSLGDMKSWLDDAASRKGWAIFMAHLVREDKGFEYSITPDDLEDVLSYAKQRNIEIRTVSGVLSLGCDRK